MAPTSANRRVITPDNSLISVRPQMAKASIEGADLSDLSGLVKESARRAHGKQGTAAAAVEMKEGNFSRDVDQGRVTLSHLAKLGPRFLAEFGRALEQEYGDHTLSPEDYAERVIGDMRQSLNELAQYVGFKRSA